MHCKLDWLSFSFAIPPIGEGDHENRVSSVVYAFHQHTAHRLLGVVTDSLWSFAPISGFYDTRITCPKTGVSISFSGGNPYALCELSGVVCENVLRVLTPANLAASTGGRCTRMDFAVDMETDISPKEFLSNWKGKRFKSRADYETETGQTTYIGSRSSERMARIYRYSPPHPRSHLLRAEIELKGDAAKAACARLAIDDLKIVCLSAHLPFGWNHALWDIGEAELSKIPARTYDRVGAGRLRWLNGTVASALKKAHEDGLINLPEWVKENFGSFL